MKLTYTKYKPLNEYQKETEYAVELIYEPFLRYPNNTQKIWHFQKKELLTMSMSETLMI